MSDFNPLTRWMLTPEESALLFGHEPPPEYDPMTCLLSWSAVDSALHVITPWLDALRVKVDPAMHLSSGYSLRLCSNASRLD